MEFEKKLSGEYLEVYKDVVSELELEEINGITTVEVKNDILDMFLSAQEDGVSARGIIGNSPKNFVKEILSNLDNSKLTLLRIGRRISQLLAGLGGIGLVNLVTERGRPFAFTIGTMALILVLMFGDFLGKYFSRKLNFGKSRRCRKNIIEWTFNVVGIVVVGIMNWPILFMINSPYVFTIGCLFIGFILLLVTDVIFK